MIQIQLTGRKYEIDRDLEKYIIRKLGRLDKYLPRGHANQGMSVEIFRDPSGREDNRYKIIAVLRVTGPDIIAETATINPHSAVDIVEQKLKQQILKYKQKNEPKRVRIKDILGRIHRR